MPMPSQRILYMFMVLAVTIASLLQLDCAVQRGISFEILYAPLFQGNHQLSTPHSPLSVSDMSLLSLCHVSNHLNAFV